MRLLHEAGSCPPWPARVMQVWGPRARRPSQETYREMMRLLREAGRLQEALHVCAGLRQTGGRPGGEEWRALTAAAAEAALRDGSTGLACKARLPAWEPKTLQNPPHPRLQGAAAAEAAPRDGSTDLACKARLPALMPTPCINPPRPQPQGCPTPECLRDRSTDLACKALLPVQEPLPCLNPSKASPVRRGCQPRALISADGSTDLACKAARHAVSQSTFSAAMEHAGAI